MEALATTPDAKAVEEKVTEESKVSKILETTKVVNATKEIIESSSPSTSTKSKSKGKVKALPLVPPFKLKTHTRTEQESLSPLLPLRGGSNSSNGSIAEIISPKTVTIPKSLPVVRNLIDGEDADDSSQILDTDAKAPVTTTWFTVLWAFVCSWCSEFRHDVKELLALVWASILLRLPFFSSKPRSAVSRSQLKKPTVKPLKTGLPLTKPEISQRKLRSEKIRKATFR